MGRNFPDDSFFDRQKTVATDGDGAAEFDQEGTTVTWLDTIGKPGVILVLEAVGSDAGWAIEGTDVDPSNGPSGTDIQTVKSETLNSGNKEIIFAGAPDYRWVRLKPGADETHHASVLQLPYAMGLDAARKFFDRATDDTQQAPQVAGDQATVAAESLDTTNDYQWETVSKPSDVLGLTWHYLIQNVGGGGNSVTTIVYYSRVPAGSRDDPASNDPAASEDWHEQAAAADTGDGAEREASFDEQALAMAIGYKAASSGNQTTVNVYGGVQ